MILTSRRPAHSERVFSCAVEDLRSRRIGLSGSDDTPALEVRGSNALEEVCASAGVAAMLSLGPPRIDAAIPSTVMTNRPQQNSRLFDPVTPVLLRRGDATSAT